MASSGFQADVKALQKLLAARHLVRFQKCLAECSVEALCWVVMFVGKYNYLAYELVTDLASVFKSLKYAYLKKKKCI